MAQSNGDELEKILEGMYHAAHTDGLNNIFKPEPKVKRYKALILADRKQHELQAKIDALDTVHKRLAGSDLNTKHYKIISKMLIEAKEGYHAAFYPAETWENPEKSLQKCGHTGVDWNGEGGCITCARDKVLGDTQELDEILDRIEELSLLVSAENSVTGSNVYGSPSAAVNRVKQAILDWHNKQVDAVLDRLEGENSIFKDYKYKDGVLVGTEIVCEGIPLSAIEAERNKLKNT